MKTQRSSLFDYHWPMVGVVFLISILGVYNLHSAAAARNPSLYLTQVTWFFFGLLLAWLMSLFDYRQSESLAYIIYSIICIFLLAVLMQGKVAGGARRWLVVGPLTFQPSELAKLALVFCLARYFSRRFLETRYSVFLLFRPLNPSRPFIGALALALYWSHAWVVDPVGELARLLAQEPAPSIGDFLWFRIFLIVIIASLAALTTMAIRRVNTQNALLNPWPKNRSKQLIAATFIFCLSLLGPLVHFWHNPILCDPFGSILSYLYTHGQPSGFYATSSPGYLLRTVLLLGVLSHGVASFVHMRQAQDKSSDLIIAPIDLLMIPAILILLEPDLGTAGLIVLVGLVMIFVVGVRAKSTLIIGALSVVVAMVGWFGVLKTYQKRRIITFIDPEGDIKGAGWNAVQSMIAVGSGRWWGKGHKEGTQSQLSFLPEQHTDFAFSVWAEEQGFVGAALLLFLYFILIFMALGIARAARDLYGTLLAVGATSIILWHILLNVGMVIGVFPVVGLTLPLFSYGGSSLMTIMCGVGLLQSIHRHRLK
jgi:cell division protein FtsW (lipid II flippase)